MYFPELQAEIELLAKKYDDDRKSILILSATISLPFIITLFISAFTEEWFFLIGGTIISIFLYFIFSFSNESKKVDQIENEIKRKIIKPKLAYIHPSINMYLHGHGHSFQDFEKANFFSSKALLRKVKVRASFSFSNYNYNLKATEIELNNMKPSLFYTIQFNDAFHPTPIIVGSGKFSIGKRKNKTNYLLFFNRRIATHEILHDDDKATAAIKELSQSIDKLLNSPEKHSKSFVVTSFINNKLNIFIADRSIFKLDLGSSMKRQNYGNDLFMITSLIKDQIEKLNF